MNNEGELCVNESGSVAMTEVAPETPTAGSMSEADAARYFRNALIGLVIGIPSFLALGFVGLFDKSVLLVWVLIVEFAAFYWGLYNFVRLKGYFGDTALLGLLYWLGFLIVVFLPNRNRAASGKVRTLSIICLAWLILGNVLGWLYFIFPVLSPFIYVGAW
jgi:hypothetical protein